jgi:hypothetical protein
VIFSDLLRFFLNIVTGNSFSCNFISIFYFKSVLFFQRDRLYCSECRSWLAYYFLNLMIMLLVFQFFFPKNIKIITLSLLTLLNTCSINLLKPTDNIQQLYALPTLHMCVVNLSENKQRLVPVPVAAHLLKSWVQIPPGAWIFVCCECRVLSGRGLCNELITRPEESYRMCYVVVCDLETSRIGDPYIYMTLVT